MDRNSPVIGAIVRAAHELLGERMEGALMPWDGKHSLESNWPNEDSGWMGLVFAKSVPDFHWERFETWIEQIYETRDPELLLRAPLCTSADVVTPIVKQPMVVGEELLQPAPKPSAEVLPPKDKIEEYDYKVLEDSYPAEKIGMAVEVLMSIMRATYISEETRTKLIKTVYAGDALVAEVWLEDEDPKFRANSEPTHVQATTEQSQGEQGGRASSDDKSLQPNQPLVEAAAKLVPMVGEEGKRVWKKPVASGLKSEPKGKVAGKSETKLDPRTWKPRKQRDGEPLAEYKAYLETWTKKQAAVAKRCGVTLK